MSVQIYGGGYGSSTYQGYEITACVDGVDQRTNPPGDTGCGEWTPLGLYGDAELKFAAGPFEIRADALAVRNEAVGERSRQYGRPILRSGPIPFGLAGSVAILIDGAYTPYDPRLGIILVLQLDCLGTPAPANIELVEPASGANRRCFRGVGQVDDCTAPGEGTFFTNVPTAWAVGLRSSLPDGRRVSRRSVLTASLWYTAVALYPLDEVGR